MIDEYERHLNSIRLVTDRPAKLCDCKNRLCLPGRDRCGYCETLLVVPVRACQGTEAGLQTASAPANLSGGNE